MCLIFYNAVTTLKGVLTHIQHSEYSIFESNTQRKRRILPIQNTDVLLHSVEVGTSIKYLSIRNNQSCLRENILSKGASGVHAHTLI